MDNTLTPAQIQRAEDLLDELKAVLNGGNSSRYVVKVIDRKLFPSLNTTKITPSDLDEVTERGGCYLVNEWKYNKQELLNMKQGQYLVLQSFARQEGSEAWVTLGCQWRQSVHHLVRIDPHLHWDHAIQHWRLGNGIEPCTKAELIANAERWLAERDAP